MRLKKSSHCAEFITLKKKNVLAEIVTKHITPTNNRCLMKVTIEVAVVWFVKALCHFSFANVCGRYFEKPYDWVFFFQLHGPVNIFARFSKTEMTHTDRAWHEVCFLVYEHTTNANQPPSSVLSVQTECSTLLWKPNSNAALGELAAHSGRFYVSCLHLIFEGAWRWQNTVSRC